MSVLADQVFLLARRSVVRTIRQPANVIAPLLFPMMLLAVNSGGHNHSRQVAVSQYPQECFRRAHNRDLFGRPKIKIQCREHAAEAGRMLFEQARYR